MDAWITCLKSIRSIFSNDVQISNLSLPHIFVHWRTHQYILSQFLASVINEKSSLQFLRRHSKSHPANVWTVCDLQGAPRKRVIWEIANTAAIRRDLPALGDWAQSAAGPSRTLWSDAEPPCLPSRWFIRNGTGWSGVSLISLVIISYRHTGGARVRNRHSGVQVWRRGRGKLLSTGSLPGTGDSWSHLELKGAPGGLDRTK